MWTVGIQVIIIQYILCTFKIFQKVTILLQMTFKNQKLPLEGGGLEHAEGLTPARLMTSTGMTVSISSAPLARMTRALFDAIFTLYFLKT